MQQYPAEHPLWSDINFTPEWLYQSIRQEAAAASRPAPRQTITGPRRFAKHCAAGCVLWQVNHLHTLLFFILKINSCIGVLAAARAAAPSGLGRTSGLHWSSVEDDMILYAHSDLGRAENFLAEAVDKLLLRWVHQSCCQVF